MARNQRSAAGCNGIGMVAIADRGSSEPASSCAAIRSFCREHRVDRPPGPGVGQVRPGDQVVRDRQRRHRGGQAVHRRRDRGDDVAAELLQRDLLRDHADVDQPEADRLLQFADRRGRQAAAPDQRVDPRALALIVGPLLQLRDRVLEREVRRPDLPQLGGAQDQVRHHLGPGVHRTDVHRQAVQVFELDDVRRGGDHDVHVVVVRPGQCGELEAAGVEEAGALIGAERGVRGGEPHVGLHPPPAAGCPPSRW